MSVESFKPSQRMQQVQSPIIPTIAKLIEQNPGTISLGQGVVYYGPPDNSINKLNGLSQSLEFNKYGSSQGLPELIALISDKLRLENNIDIDSGNKIIVTAGANMAFLHTLFAITDPDDEIILNTPYYFNHEMAISMLNCKTVLVPTDDQYQLQPEKILGAITNKTRAVVTVSPNNPTGAVYPEELLQRINQICTDNGIYHISDEAYENFTFDNTRHFSPASIDDARNHTISLFSLSKAYGFAAWRVGYMLVPEHLQEAIVKAQDTNLICPPLASQYAAIGALETGADYCREKLPLINDVRNELFEKLSYLGDFCQYPSSRGALYVFLKLDTELSDMQVVEYLIEKHRVAVIPGYTFGMRDHCHIRVSYGALDKESADEGIRRLISGLTAIMNKTN